MAAEPARAIQVSLGLIWLLDGALQLQPYMYGGGFIASLRANISGQPPWLAHTLSWAASTLQSQQALFNTAFALVQIAIGLGLIWRPSVRPALALSFAWALVVWWFGEGLGMLLATTPSPLAGAPGAAILYVPVGLLAWPAARPGGLLGARGARLMWAALWLALAWMWLASCGARQGAVSQAIAAAPSGPGPLHSIQAWLAGASAGGGIAIGIAFAASSALIGIAVLRGWHARWFLGLSIALELALWIVGQGLGGMLAGGATDPNSGPLLVLLACAMYAVVPGRGPGATIAGRIEWPAPSVGQGQVAGSHGASWRRRPGVYVRSRAPGGRC